MLKKKWLIRPHSNEIALMSNSLNVSEITAKILIDRGIQSIDQARTFLYPKYENLHSPWLLPDMEPAVKRIKQALENNEHITIYGDYDVDGQTSVALLLYVLRSLASDINTIDYYVPNRIEEGYGLHKEALQTIAEVSSLVITVDCGIAAINEADFARSIGLDLIITDHHEPGLQLPEAVAVINPKCHESKYPFTELAGVGVAYKLVQALAESYGKDFCQWLDLVALGTVTDLVPLVDENRIFVKLGLNQLEHSSILGLRALLQVCNIKPPYNTSDLGFKLGPRLNAVGRMGEPARGIELLISSDNEEAFKLAGVLDSENKLRQHIEVEIFTEAVSMIEANGWNKEPVIVIANEKWHAGVIGIVASRLVEKYYRPTVVIAIEDGVGKGSARSISGFNLYAGLGACKELLLEFGGHEMAAGLSIDVKCITALRKKLSQLAAETLSPEDFIPKVRIDSKIDLKEIDVQLLNELKLLEPFGMGNPTPVFKVSGSVLNTRAMGIDGDHLRCCIQDQDGEMIEAVGFGMYQAMQDYEKYREQIDFAVYPQHGYYDPNKFELILRDFRISGEAETYIEDWIISRYPWVLPQTFQDVSHIHTPLDIDNPVINRCSGVNIIDCRGSWDKKKELMTRSGAHKHVLIYTASPERALTLCRSLRIAVPNGNKFIGFEHELITEAERQELNELIDFGTLRWIVSTGVWLSNRKWDQIVLYDAFCDARLIYNLINQLNTQGELIFLYGKKDCHWLQGKVQSMFPNREILARFYLGLIKNKKEISMDEIENLAKGWHLSESTMYSLGIFQELALIEKEDNIVKIMPKPAQRLDLNTSVLYNKCITKREQCLAYLQLCLERGFIDEFKGQD